MGLAQSLGAVLGAASIAATPVTSAARDIATSPRTRPVPVSGAGTRISAGIIDDIDHNQEVRGSKWYGSPGKIGFSGKMLRDPHVAQSIEFYISALTSGIWRFTPASPSPIDREVADFCSWAFFESLPWDLILQSWAEGYMSNGFHLSEMTDSMGAISAERFPLHPGEGVGLVPTGFHDVPAWSVYRWLQSKRNPRQLFGIEQWIQGSDNEKPEFKTIRASRLFRLSYRQQGANFEGEAILRRAYQPWKLKMAFLTIDAIKHERIGLGTPAMTLNEGADQDDIDAAETILAEMRVNEKGFLILPFGYEFEWANAKGSDGSNLDQAISRCNIDIAHNVAAGFMLLGLANKAGSFALGGTQQGQHHLQAVAHAKFVCSTLKVGSDGWSPVRRIVTLNYGTDVALPTPQCRNLPTRNWQDVAKTYFIGVQTGALVADAKTEDVIREALELPPHDPDTARERMGAPMAMMPGDEPESDDSDDAIEDLDDSDDEDFEEAA